MTQHRRICLQQQSQQRVKNDLFQYDVRFSDEI